MATALIMAIDIPYQVGRRAAEIELEFRISNFQLRNADSELLREVGELEEIAKGYAPLQDLDFARGYEDGKRENDTKFRKRFKTSLNPDAGTTVPAWMMYTGAFDL